MSREYVIFKFEQELFYRGKAAKIPVRFPTWLNQFASHFIEVLAVDVVMSPVVVATTDRMIHCSLYLCLLRMVVFERFNSSDMSVIWDPIFAIQRALRVVRCSQSDPCPISRRKFSPNLRWQVFFYRATLMSKCNSSCRPVSVCMSVCLSVRPSVRMSVTLVYYIQTAEDNVTLFSHRDSPITLVYFCPSNVTQF